MNNVKIFNIKMYTQYITEYYQLFVMKKKIKNIYSYFVY